MRTILINIIIFAAVLAIYYTDFFGFFTSSFAFWGALVLVIVLLLIAVKVLGNPFAGGDNDENS